MAADRVHGREEMRAGCGCGTGMCVAVGVIEGLEVEHMRAEGGAVVVAGGLHVGVHVVEGGKQTTQRGVEVLQAVASGGGGGVIGLEEGQI